jgi:outer membrane protein OmpA-like peptidoglycan-associated protein
MVSKVRVYGKAQNRIVLGIVHAYMIMYPQATAADLRKAFPDSLAYNQDIFIDSTKMKPTDVDWRFTEKDELIKTSDGKKLALAHMWPEQFFKGMVSHASQYGIEVAKFEKGERGVKGGYRLEYLNGYVPPKAKKSKTWLWVLIAAFIVIAGLLAWLLMRPKQVVEVEKVVTVVDTVYLQQIEEIERNFNAAEFVVGKSDLSDDAKFVLHDLAKVMAKNPQLKLRLEGHTSAEGDAAFNQKLSDARAHAAVDFLVQHEGIDASRLEAIGYGSSKLKNTANPNAPENRRTEFIVIE